MGESSNEARLVTSSSKVLQTRKRQLVRDTIWDAAIDLFAEKGFEQTTVEEIADAAGVSRRSFFRYFSSKRDLMTQGMVTYEKWLTEAIRKCPRSSTAIEMMERVTLEVAAQVVQGSRTRQVVRIGENNPAAREAILSSLSSVEDHVAQAYGARLGKAKKDPLKPRLLTSMTLSILSLAINAWAANEGSDISSIVRRAYANLRQLVCEPGGR
jgi:AcrR family transcriptional regulator